ncbi:MAG: hypothetical protein HPY76_10290 [Anaerolineae bacterium]|nr:hypothetical protein [Anaerolineae bacterium]
MAIINTEMVDTAFWVNEHLDQDAIIAVHDIGAIGYYTSLRMIDLAGLISPDVIPIMRNEHALEEYLSDNGADYLIVFPGWYPELSRDLQIVYRSKGVFSLTAGGENMTVYLFSTPDQ